MNRIAWIFVLALAVGLVPGMADINLILNPGFELGLINPHNAPGFASLWDVSNWNITDPGNQDATGVCQTGGGNSCSNGLAPHSGIAWMYGGAFTNPSNLSGTPGTGVQQSIATAVGQSYSLTFFLAEVGTSSPPPPADNSWSVAWNGNVIGSGQNLAAFGYAQQNFSVVGTGSDTLQFSFFDNSGLGYELDDVSLTAVPDGGTTLSLLGLAIVGLAGLRRKLSL